MRLQDLYDAAASLAASVIPTGTPSVPAITASATTTDPVAARERLQGALVKAAGGEYFLVPAEASTLGAGSKKIPLSATGNFADATDRSEAQLAALSISEVALNIVLGTASTSTSPTLRVAGKPDGLPVTLAPIIEPALTRMRATVAGGTTTDITRRKARARNELVHPKRGCVDECVWGGCEEHAEHARNGHRGMSEMTATG
jgi:hypothetical protein